MSILCFSLRKDVFMGDIISLCLDRRGIQKESRNLDSERVIMTFKLPLNEIVVDFYDKLKHLTSGYASFDYEELGYEKSNLAKVTNCTLYPGVYESKC